jgi:hypothetical protein
MFFVRKPLRKPLHIPVEFQDLQASLFKSIFVPAEQKRK